MHVRTCCATTVVVLSFTGCATLLNSTPQSIYVTSSSQKTGIKVEVTTAEGSYPTSLPSTINATSNWTWPSIEVVDDCYEHVTVLLPRSIAPSYWLNILNMYGFLIDPLTGRLWHYDNYVILPLEEKVECSRQKLSGKSISPAIPNDRGSEAKPSEVPFAHNIHWKIDTDPQGAAIQYRIVSSTPEVANTANTYLERSPYEGVKAMNIKGVNHKNIEYVSLSIEVSKPGYYTQKKDISLSAIEQSDEVSIYFSLVRVEP